MIVAVTGGSGFIGRHLVSALVKQGVHVRLLTRHPEALQQLWPENKVEPWAGDVTRPETLRGFAKDADVVFHLAGEIKNSTRFAMVNEMGTKNVLEACRDQELKKFMYLSSVGVIGAIGKGTIDEYTPCHPNNPYEKSKYAGEHIALAACKKYQVPVAVIRPTIVFGEEPNRDRDSLLAWLTAIQKGWFRYIGSDNTVANYVYVGDVVRACLLVAEKDKAIGEVYIVSDSCPLRDFVGAATEFLGVRMPGNMPILLAYILAGGFEIAGRLAHFSVPLTVSRVKALTSRIAYRSDKIRKKLGFAPKVGWREGLRRTVAWYKREDMIVANK